MRRFAQLSVLLMASVPALSHPQAKKIPIVAVTPPVLSSERFSAQPNVRGLPGEKVLVNDQRGQRLLVFDSTLAKVTISADSAATNGMRYPGLGGVNTLMRFDGDSTLLYEPTARAYLIIEPDGKIGRAMAPPNSHDGGITSRGYPGNPASDGHGRLIYRAEGTNHPDPKPGDPPITATRDTINIVRADFSTRVVDTIASFTAPRSGRPIVVDGAKGKKVGTLLLNAGLTTPDEWVVMSDGTLAVVREHDYHIDWLGADGSKSSTGKLPFDWLRQTDEMKQARVDSMKRVIDSVNTTGRPYGTMYMFSRRADGTSQADTVVPTITFAPLSAMADYTAPMRRGFVKADEENNVWILPTTTVQARGGLLYDVVNKRDELFQRVQLPPDFIIVGFGKGGVLYLARNDAATKSWQLARARLVKPHSAQP